MATKEATRPVKLSAVLYPILNPESKVMYRPGTVTDLNDLNAPSAHFERSQLAANVLGIVED